MTKRHFNLATSVTFIVGSALMLSGCLGSSGGSKDRIGPPGSGITSLEHDAGGVFQTRVAIDDVAGVRAISDELMFMGGPDGPDGVLDSLTGAIQSAYMMSATAQNDEEAASLLRERRKAHRAAAKERRLSEDASATLQVQSYELEPLQASTEGCPAGGEVTVNLSQNYTANKDYYLFQTSFNECGVGYDDGVLVLNGSFSVEEIETYSDSRYTSVEKGVFNISGALDGTPHLVIRGNFSWEYDEREISAAEDRIIEKGRTPRLEFVNGDFYWALVDEYFEYEGRYNYNTGRETGTEKLQGAVGSSHLGGYATFITTQSLGYEFDPWDDYICPISGVITLTGASGSSGEIRFGLSTGVGAAATVEALGGTESESFATCQEFTSSYSWGGY